MIIYKIKIKERLDFAEIYTLFFVSLDQSLKKIYLKDILQSKRINRYKINKLILEVTQINIILQ